MKYLALLLSFLFTSAFSVFSQSTCQAGFTYSATGDSVAFTDTSNTSSAIAGYSWDFGDGSTSAQIDPSHEYLNGGYYTVSLTIITVDSCISTASEIILVNSPCTPSFTYTVDPNTGATAFTPSPANPDLQYSWNFDDLGMSSSMTPTNGYSPGTYVPCLTITDTSGICSGTFCDTVVVPQRTCFSSFTIDSLGSNNFSFTASNIDSSLSYTWSFSDGGSSFGPVASHTYSGSGTFEICLTVIDSATNCSSLFCDSLTVIATPTCNATFSFTIINDSVSFNASPFDSSWTYSWDFGDMTIGTGMNPSHVYSANGSYGVCLFVQDTSTSCSFTVCDTLVINTGTATCNATFTYIDSNGFVYFEATPMDSTSVYTWDFGDGNTGTGAIVFNSFTASGGYNVCLTVTDSIDNCTNTFCDSVFVLVQNCSVSFNYSVDSTGSVTFNVDSVIAGTEYSWDFGDFSPADSGSTVSHDYFFSGDYVVCLTSKDSATGCMATFCDTVTVIVPPNCNSTFTAFPFNANVTFTVQPINPGISYTFDFGDGVVAPVNAFGFAFHTYAASGTYYVCLNAVDSMGGCSNQYCDSVTVIIPGCTLSANFLVSNLSVGKIAVTASEINPFYNYTWTFMAPPPDFAVVAGFGISDTAHTFTSNGIKQVCLKIDDFLSGCADSLCKLVTISGINVEELDAFRSSVSIYPNPASEGANLKFTLKKSEIVTIELLDLTGKQIIEITDNEMVSGENKVYIPLETISKGIYMISIKAGGNQVLHRLIRN